MRPRLSGLRRKAAPRTPKGPEPVDVPVREEVIRLGQFLKLANLIDTGAEAKEVCPAGLVKVNGEVDTRRGRQLQDGDVVELRGQAARVVAGVDAAVEDDLPW
ncbi:RNA-binding S4 domain-containing protein [Nocardioides sp.]|uniref:RNA-binding S4 domain-containing protein n=1 Tax=Nocardioides sp. TaxID=35761 RepID=UPI002BA211A2|nr:RNA-binding S4 domain-containing protein [Nocardioides sp.]HSX66111.1 RNA-binding S4 domain-containing protein [Nocardioides sp.]